MPPKEAFFNGKKEGLLTPQNSLKNKAKCSFLHLKTHIRGAKTAFFDCFGNAKEMALQESLERRFFVALRQKNPHQKMLKNLCFERLFPAVFYAKTPPPTPPKSKAETPVLSPFYMNPIFKKMTKAFASYILRFNCRFWSKPHKEKGVFSFFYSFFERCTVPW